MKRFMSCLKVVLVLVALAASMGLSGCGDHHHHGDHGGSHGR